MMAPVYYSKSLCIKRHGRRCCLPTTIPMHIIVDSKKNEWLEQMRRQDGITCELRQKSERGPSQEQWRPPAHVWKKDVEFTVSSDNWLSINTPNWYLKMSETASPDCELKRHFIALVIRNDRCRLGYCINLRCYSNTFNFPMSSSLLNHDPGVL
jgi:hypothetical protein